MIDQNEGENMKLLAVDSSGMTASVAIYEEDKVTAEYSVNFQKTHSQTLLPMIDEIVRMVKLDLSMLDAIAIAAGPGSFTGLRIGSATVKGIGLAIGKPIIEVPTLEAMAYNAFGMEGLICPMIDARNHQVFTGVYRMDKEQGVMIPVIDQEAVTLDEITDAINDSGESVVLLGDGADVYRNELMEKLTVPATILPPFMNRQRASLVGYAAAHYYQNGKMVSAAEHRPIYLRVSQAERERAKREALKRDEIK